MLTEQGYNVVLFNGQNSDSDAKRIYEWWIKKHKYDDKITGSKNADMRAALVEYFRDYADIMVATESASEGINLQFCSLIVNYDLPWNPQRIEQRIGRCHRYGQKYDVVVINFLNQKNAADQRVYDLLSEKFKLFEGLFGSSDEILGSLESGVDFEKRIQEIYQNCRTAEEIDDAFNRLQEELDEQIRIKMQETRISLMENFDDEVREKLRDNFEQTTIQLNKLERFLWNLSKIEGQREAVFDDNSLSFIKDKKKYQLMSQIKKEESTNNVVHYRLSHPLAEKWVKQAKGRVLIPKEVTFRYCDYQGKISVIESLVGTGGWLHLDLLNVESVENEQYLIFSAVDNNGNQIEQDICEKLFLLPAIEHEEIEIPNSINNTLQYIKECQVEAVLNSIMERTAEYMDSELEKLDRWAKDLKLKLEAEIDELSVEIDYLKKESKSIRNLQEKLEMNKKIKELEKKRNDMRRNLYDQQDQIDEQKDILFEEIEAKLQQKVTNCR
ncbi:helicase-related protein [Aeribacillus sp. FSL K6-2833]|uniref:helicase-related protein n=1 Tax=Aeribacillus sp. FSL K6-2833 TaxID=2954611 RepID=UPI0030DD06B5